MTLHALLRARVRGRARVPARLSEASRPCDALSIEKVVICKSPLLWAGGVKLGERGRRSGTGGKRRSDRGRRRCE